MLSFLLPLFFKKGSYLRKYVHEVLVNRSGGLSLPRKSVVRLTHRPDMTLNVYRGRKTTMQQQQQPSTGLRKEVVERCFSSIRSGGHLVRRSKTV